jgi:8-oxo-dGTP pyrophosphatase MutT (NUDIX family)
VPADDPTELFDVCDAEGRLVGRTKPRAEVHRDGDWHRSVHLWVVVDGTSPATPERGLHLAGTSGPSIVFQRRSMKKDTHPGRVDVSVAGHLRAGEDVSAVLREAEEEIGLRLILGDLVRLGVRHREDRTSPERIDREHQEVFFAVARCAFESLRPDRDEVDALLRVPLASAEALCDGREEAVGAREVRTSEPGERDVVLHRAELGLVPDGYFARALGSISERLEGRKSAPWRIDSR